VTKLLLSFGHQLAREDKPQSLL